MEKILAKYLQGVTTVIEDGVTFYKWRGHNELQENLGCSVNHSKLSKFDLDEKYVITRRITIDTKRGQQTHPCSLICMQGIIALILCSNKQTGNKELRGLILDELMKGIK